jgi:hypothetical protein
VHEFDRATGVEDPDGRPVIINSVAPLPADIRDIMLGLDRKYREAEYRRAEDPEWRMPPEEARLSEEESAACSSSASSTRTIRSRDDPSVDL